MTVDKGKIVSLEYTLKNAEGAVLDRSDRDEPLDYLHGAGNIIPGLERALAGRNPGERVEVSVEPKDGYGDRDESLMVELPRERFEVEGTVKPGMRFSASTPQGPQVFTVVGVEGDGVTIDGNHPLAGQTLHFDVKVVDVRDATQEELDHGHPHGPGGHHH